MASSLIKRHGETIMIDTVEDHPGQKGASPAELDLVQRVIATPAFTRSVLLTRFLQYICDRKFSGHAEEITEYQIGVQALGRPDSYNPSEDNIVRTYARILRKRLEEYFAGDGREEPVCIVIPVGHYVPVFETNLPAPVRHSSDNEEQPVSDSSVGGVAPAGMGKAPLWRSLRRLWVPAVLLLAVCIGADTYWRIHVRFRSINDIFWREVLNHGSVTYLVPGDSGLAMMQEITGKEVHLSDYIAGDLDEEFHDFNLAAARGGTEYGFDRVSNFTSKADLSIAVGIAKLAQMYGGQLKVCYSRYMNMESFKGSNAILVGGPRANPWVELFEPESNFRMYFPMHVDGIHFDERTFINKHPRAGEQSTYTNQLDDTSHRTYALLSFLPETDGVGHVLLLEGGGMAGTQAAGDFLLNPREMEPVLRKAQLADGSIGPFEVLIEARTVGVNAPEEHAVVERFGITKTNE
ncbi:MAG: hypothetical protein WBE72_17200 [Terracidiphilus sp.]